MPVVGEAIIRLRVTSDRLGADISRAVRESVQGANSDIDTAGQRAGERFNRSFTNGIRNGSNTRQNEGDRAAGDVTRGVTNRTNRDRPTLSRLFGRTGTSMTEDFKKEFNLGIGAARMGPAVIGALALATPSILSGVGSLAGALGAQLVSTIAAAAPAIAGAGVLGAAALSTLGLNFGLLKLAFASTSAAGKALKADMADLKTSLTETFAPGVLAGFTDLIGQLKTDLLPGVREQLQQTGVAMGDIARGLGQTLTAGQNLQRLQGILATNTTFLGNLKTGVSGLTTSFLILFNAAKPFIDFLGQGIAKFGDWAANALTVAEANGSLATLMTTLLTKFRSAAQAIGDIVVGIYNIGKAAAPVGQAIGDISQKFRDWTEKPENQVRMVQFFEKMHTLASGVGKLLGQLGAAAAGALERLDTTNLLAILTVIGEKWGPAIAQIFGQISAGSGKNLVQIFDDLGTVLQNIAASGVIEDVARGFSRLLAAMSGFIRELSENPIGAKILGLAAGFALFGGILSPLISGVKLLAAGFSALGGALSVPALIVAAIAAAFVLVYTQSEKLRGAIAELGAAIWEKLQVIWTFLQPALERLWPAILRAAKAIGDFLAPILQALVPILTTVVGAFGVWLVAIIDAFTLLADFVTGFLSGDWQPFIDDWNKITEQAKAWWDNDFVPWWNQLWENIKQWAIDKWDELKTWLGKIWDDIIAWGKQKWADFGVWLESLWPAMINWAAVKWEEFRIWLQLMWQNIVIEAIIKWEEFKTWLATFWDTVILLAEMKWGEFQVWLSNLWIGINDWAQQKWDEFTVWWSTLFPNLIVLATNLWTEFQIWLQLLWQNILIDAQAKWAEFQGWMFSLIPNIIASAVIAWEQFKAYLVQLWVNIIIDAQVAWEQFKSWLLSLLIGFSAAALAIWNGFWAGLNVIWQGIIGDAVSAWSNFTSVISAMFQAWVAEVLSIADGFLAGLAVIWNNIVGDIEGAFESIPAILEGVWTTIGMSMTGPFQAAYETIVTIAGWISGVVSGILSTVSTALETVNSKLTDMLAAQAAGSAIQATAAASQAEQIAGIGTMTPSKIEQSFGDALTRANFGVNFGGALAKGGTVPAVNGGQMFLLGEAGRRERVEPLDSQGLSNRDRALISSIVRSMTPSSGGGGVSTVSVRIGERELTDIVTDVVAAREDSQARAVRNRRPS